MKKQSLSLSFVFARIRVLVFVIASFCGFLLNISAQDFKTIQPGVEYVQTEKMISGLKVRISLIRLDLTKVRLDVVHAMDAAIGIETTSSIAKRHNAIAAINAGFFRLDKSIFAGEDVGVLMIDENLVSESSNGRIALLIANGITRTDVNFEHLDTSEELQINGQTFILNGIDRERKADELVRYTPYFHRTTLTHIDGTELIIRKGKIVSIKDGNGGSVIPSDGYVISASGTFRQKILEAAKLGQKVAVRSGSNFYGSEDIVAGVPQLIKNGKIDISWEQEKASRSFVETRHPRTAVAILKDDKFLMVTVDGRSETSGGIGLYDLAEYLLELGAVNAMNLDGGGSTTMYLDGKVVNTPSDKEGERKIGDALIVTLRK